MKKSFVKLLRDYWKNSAKSRVFVEFDDGTREEMEVLVHERPDFEPWKELLSGERLGRERFFVRATYLKDGFPSLGRCCCRNARAERGEPFGQLRVHGAGCDAAP